MIVVHRWMQDRVRVVAIAMGVNHGELLARSCTGRVMRGRSQHLSRTRAIAAYLMRVAPIGVEPSYPEIAAALGYGSHASSHGAVKMVVASPELLTQAQRVADATGIRLLPPRPGAVPRVPAKRETPAA